MSEQNEQAVSTEPLFNIEKLYIKDLSLEVPHAPEVFLAQEQPEVEMKVAAQGVKIEDGFFECSVTVTVTATLQDKRVMFLNEVVQAGIFQIQNMSDEDVSLLLGVACPNILFPYAREAVSSTITRAGFPPVLLAPINFEAMYQQNQDSEGQA